jgi:hypothetical protein
MAAVTKNRKYGKIQFPSKPIKVFRKIGWVSIPSKYIKVFDAGLHNQRLCQRKL